MLEQALTIAQEALKSGDHAGYSTHYLHFEISFIRSVQGSIAFETQAVGHGLDLFLEVQDIRARYARPDDAEDQFWLASAQANVAAPLMAEGRSQEALEILEKLLKRPDLTSNHDVYLENISLCLRLLGRYQEALAYSLKALDAAERMKGRDSEQVASQVYPLENHRMRLTTRKQNIFH